MYMLGRHRSGRSNKTLLWMHKQSKENSVQWKALQVVPAEGRTCNKNVQAGEFPYEPYKYSSRLVQQIIPPYSNYKTNYLLGSHIVSYIVLWVALH